MLNNIYSKRQPILSTTQVFFCRVKIFMDKNKTLKKIKKALRKPALIVLYAFYDYFERKNPTNDMIQMRELSIQHAEDILRVCDMLEDDKSKEIYRNMIMYRKTKDRKYLRKTNVSVKDQYFCDDIIKLSGNEIFIDGGAYDGENSLDFAHLCNGKYIKIYAFEPSKLNLQLLNKTIKQNELKNIKVFDLGLWSDKDTLYFNDIDSAGSLSASETTIEIDVDSIDNILMNESVTFIKMDIEGAELEALKGAAMTIQKNKPKLAICIYHKPEDLYQIPMYIKSLVPEYKLYVRQHTYIHTETVLYAVI